jgi:hypothetical protein
MLLLNKIDYYIIIDNIVIASVMMYSRFPSLVSTMRILPTEDLCKCFIKRQLGISKDSDAYHAILALVRQYHACDKQLESAYNYHRTFGAIDGYDGYTLIRDVTKLSRKKNECFRKIRQIRKEYARKLSDEEIADIAHSRLRSLFANSGIAHQ